jgi:hypothetical protein
LYRVSDLLDLGASIEDRRKYFVATDEGGSPRARAAAQNPDCSIHAISSVEGQYGCRFCAQALYLVYVPNYLPARESLAESESSESIILAS